MTVLLRFRVLVITLFFALLAIGLTLLVKIAELKLYYLTLAPLLAMIVSFLILLLLKKERSKKILNKLKVIALVAFGCFLVTLFIYFNLFNKSTFKFLHADGSVTYHVKGNTSSYSETALAFKKQNPGISDDELISLGFTNPDYKKWAWSEESIKKNLLWLIIGYCVLVVLLAAFLAFVFESFAQKSLRNKLLLYDPEDEGELAVFISYNHGDKEVAHRLKEMLEKEDIKVIIDSDAMLAGENIKEFIERAILSSQVTLAVISKESLLSSWVSFETIGTFFIERFSNSKRFIAAYLYKDFFDLTFTSEAIKTLNVQLETIKNLIAERDKLRLDARDLNEDKSRLLFLLNNLDDIIHRLKSSLCMDISNGKLDENFPLLLKSIRNTAEVMADQEE